MAKGEVFIGTSGWQYDHWRVNFYPSDLSQKDWLKFYSEHFDTVEVNSSFYRQTRASTFERWKREVSKGFTFSIKGNRFITHIKRLNDCKEAIERFFESASLLTNHKSLNTNHVILWQLPPSLKVDIGRLKSFISVLPRTFRHVFEFRHETWGVGEVKKALKVSGKEIALVLQDWKDWPIYEEPVGNFVYIRFHGKDQLYTSGYTQEHLAIWAKKVQKWMSSGLDVYAYFNNDALGYAVPNAQTLKKLVS